MSNFTIFCCFLLASVFAKTSLSWTALDTRPDAAANAVLEKERVLEGTKAVIDRLDSREIVKRNMDTASFIVEWKELIISRHRKIEERKFQFG